LEGKRKKFKQNDGDLAKGGGGGGGGGDSKSNAFRWAFKEEGKNKEKKPGKRKDATKNHRE